MMHHGVEANAVAVLPVGHGAGGAAPPGDTSWLVHIYRNHLLTKQAACRENENWVGLTHTLCMARG